MQRLSVNRFVPAHFEVLEVQPAQAYWREHATPEYLEHLAASCAYSISIGDCLVACAGIIEMSPTNGHMWSLLSVHARTHLLRLHRVAQRLMEVSGKRYLIATTEIDFPAGCRWLELLGFRSFGSVSKGGPDGRDHFIYVLER